MEQENSGAALRIVLMDAKPINIFIFEHLLARLPWRIDVVASVNSRAELQRLVGIVSFDAVIMELNGVDETSFNGITFLREMQQRLPSCRLILLTDLQDVRILSMVESLNIAGIISRDESVATIIRFLMQALTGWPVISPYIRESMQIGSEKVTSIRDRLTTSEFEVLRYLLQGWTQSQIAKHQGRSLKTISAHKCNAMRKLGIKNNASLFTLLQSNEMISH